MNKIYKVIWSKTRNCYVVVSEMAKHCAKSSGVASSRTKTARVLGAVLLCACLAGGYNIQAAHAEDEIKEAGVAGSNVTRAGYSNASAWGNATTAEGTNSTAWGIKTRAKGQNTTAWGNETIAEGANATAWGLKSQAIGTNSTAFGNSSIANGMNSLAALGGITAAGASGSIAIGLESSASGMHSVAIGLEAKADLAHSVAMGGYSVANRAAGVTGYNPSGSAVNGNAWVATQSAVSVGASATDSDTATVTRQITGVAAGTFDTDAVNVAQLKSAMQNAGSGQTYTAGDGIVIDKESNKISVKSSNIVPDADGFAKAAAVYMEVRPHSDGAYIKKAYSTGQNLAILDEQVRQTGGALKEEIKNRTTAVSEEAAARISEDAALSNRIGSLSANGQYIKATNDVAANLAALDTNLATGLRREAADRNASIENTSRALAAADTALSNRIGSLSANGQYIKVANDVATNLAALDTNLATGLRREAADRNASIENTSRALAAADTALSNRIGSLSANGQYIKTTNNVAANLAVLDSNLATGLRREAADRNASIDNVSRALAAADTALTERIDTEAKDRADADAVLSQLIDKEHSERLSENATLGNQISTEVSERKTADATLGSRISTETSERKAEDANLGKRIDTEISERKTAVTNLGNRISTETSERKAEDAALGSRISTEVSERKTADTNLGNRISTETSERKAEDATLGSRISTEVSERKTADTNLGKRIDSEITERTAADTALSNRIGSLSANGNYIAKSDSISKNLTALDTQLKNTVTGLQTETAERKTAVSNEVYARESADTALSNRIGSLSKDGNYIRKNYDVSYNMTLLDSQMKAADTAIQALANVDIATIEVMAEYVDVVVENKRNIQTNTGDIINLNKKTTDLETALNRETTNRTSADNTLDSKIKQEVSDRTEANRALEADINKEVSDRAAADTALGNRIDTETSERKSADTALGKRIDTETSERKSADTALGKRIDTETSERKSADTALGNRIDQEAAERTAADKALESLIAKEAAARGETELVMAALIDEEAADREAGDTALGARIDKEASDRDSADKALEARIDKEASDRDSADKALGARIDKEASDRDAADKALGSRIDKEASDRAAADTALSGRIGTLAGDGSVIRKDSNVSENLAMLDQALQEQAAMDEEILENKANADASNVGRNAIVKDNSADWGAALGTGAVQSKNGKLVTGDTVYNEVRAGSDGAYIKAANTAAANLTALDEQMSANTDAIDQNREDIAANAADIADNRDAIAANAADIAANAADIAENRDAIATNAAGIATNTKKIAAVKTTADTALSGVSVLLIGTGLNIDEIVATDQKVNELAENEAVIANRDYVETVEQEDGTTKEVAKSREFVRGYTVYEYLNGKPGEENAAMTLGQNAERIAIGKGSAVRSGINSIALGTDNTVDGDRNIAIGTGHTVKGSGNIAIGDPIKLDGSNNGVFGNNVKISGNNNFMIGNSNTALTVDDISGNSNFVLGNGSTVAGNNTIVIGNNVTANVSDAVVLGDGSTAEAGAVSVGSATNPRPIKNVAPGTDDTDAATWRQVKDVAQTAYNNDVYLSNSINRLDSKVNKVGAGAAALAALHPVEMDNKFGMGLGYGNYRDAHSMAVGLFYRPKDNLMFSIGGSMGNGENMVNAGISIALDKGFTSSKAVMARKIAAQDNIIAAQGAELEAQKKENEQQKAEIQALKEALARLEAKIGK